MIGIGRQVIAATANPQPVVPSRPWPTPMTSRPIAAELDRQAALFQPERPATANFWRLAEARI
jgi:hypothetical protein